MMKMNAEGLKLLKEFEGCRLEAYQDPVGVWTIGYGLTAASGVIKPYKGLKISQARAEELLIAALGPYEKAVSEAITAPVNENQFSAMVSLCYNIGPKNFRDSSVRKLFNLGNTAGAAEMFKLWNKAGGKVLQGLVRRRAAERALFLKPVSAAVVPPPDIEPPPTVTDADPPRTTAGQLGPRSLWAWLISLFTAPRGSR